MANRFVPTLNETRKVLDYFQNHLNDSLPNAEEYWIKALSATLGSELKAFSVTDVHATLIGGVTGGVGIPWIFYDTLSELIRLLSPFTREMLIHDSNIETGYEFEQLRLTSDGRWQIVWTVNPDAYRPTIGKLPSTGIFLPGKRRLRREFHSSPIPY